MSAQCACCGSVRATFPILPPLVADWGSPLTLARSTMCVLHIYLPPLGGYVALIKTSVCLSPSGLGREGGINATPGCRTPRCSFFALHNSSGYGPRESCPFYDLIRTSECGPHCVQSCSWVRPVRPIPGSTALWEFGDATGAGVFLRFILIAPLHVQHFNDTGSTTALEKHLRQRPQSRWPTSPLCRHGR